MGQWSRAALSDAFEQQQAVVAEIGRSWEWSRYADLFTEDAEYVEHALGNHHGREEIRSWIVPTMNMFPGTEMPLYPVSWASIDTDKGWVIAEMMNRMRDPGDGSIHQSACITILKYAGDGLWSYEEDAYNPMNFLVMIQGYAQACARLGTLSDDARTFARNMNWELVSAAEA